MPFETTVAAGAPATFQTPLLGVAVPQGGALPASLAPLDAATGGAGRRAFPAAPPGAALGRLDAAGDFTGNRDEPAILYPSGPAGRVVLVGLGKTEAEAR